MWKKYPFPPNSMCSNRRKYHSKLSSTFIIHEWIIHHQVDETHYEIRHIYVSIEAIKRFSRHAWNNRTMWTNNENDHSVHFNQQTLSFLCYDYSFHQWIFYAITSLKWGKIRNCHYDKEKLVTFCHLNLAICHSCTIAQMVREFPLAEYSLVQLDHQQAPQYLLVPVESHLVALKCNQYKNKAY